MHQKTKSRYLFTVLLLTSLLVNFLPFQARGEDSYEENDSRGTAINIRKQFSNYSEKFNGTHIIHQWTFSHLTLANVTNEEDWFAFPMKLGETCYVSAWIHSGGTLGIELWKGDNLEVTYYTNFLMDDFTAEAVQNLSIGFRWFTGDPIDYSFNITEFFAYFPSPILPLRMGWDYWFSSIDPIESWDSASWNYIEQICEGLYAWESINSTFQLVPRLAAEVGTWSSDFLEYTVHLRTNVSFHDGTPFNAAAVKWNFDRLYYYLNQGYSYVYDYSPLATLYPAHPFVINETQILNSATVRFRLNYPFGGFEQLLTFFGSYMISPTSTPWDRQLVFGKDRLVGTGPYVQVLLNEQYAIFKANINYYRPQPAVQEMHWILFSNLQECNEALLTHSIQLINYASTQYLENYTADPELTYLPNQPGTIFSHLAMNNNRINKTFRQAISYAINYSYIIDVIRQGLTTRAEHWIQFGLPYYNSSIYTANYDVSHARAILIAAGIAPPEAILWTDADWLAVALGTTPFASYNFTYNVGNLWRQQLGALLKINLQAIGIQLTVYSAAWSDYLNKLFYHPEQLELFSSGWAPDYADPVSSLHPTIYGRFGSDYGNVGQVNDTTLDSMLIQAMSTPDPDVRQQTYNIIQEYLSSDLMPYAFLYTSNYFDVHLNWLGNFHRNPMGVLDIYRCTWNPAGSSYIYISQPNLINITQYTPFTLGWTPFLIGDLTPSYYEIRELTTNTTLVAYELYSNASLVTLNHSGLTIGWYYFQITFYTQEGMWSSCIINVQVMTSSTYTLTIEQPNTLTVYSQLPFILPWTPHQSGGLTATYCEIWDFYANQLLMTANYTFENEINYGHSALPAGNYAFRAIFYTAQGVSNSCIIYVTVQPSHFYVTIPTEVTIDTIGAITLYYTADLTPGLSPTMIYVYWENWSVNAIVSYGFSSLIIYVPSYGTYKYHVVFNTTQGVSTTVDIQITAIPSVTNTTTTTKTTTTPTSTTSTTTPPTTETPTNPFKISSFSPFVLFMVCAVVTGVLISFTRKKFR